MGHGRDHAVCSCGATVDLHYAASAGIAAVVLILGVLIFRMAGVWCCMLGTNLNKKERIFCMFAYMPKATVQAAIGACRLQWDFPAEISFLQ